MTPMEVNFLLWAIGILLSILAFVGIIAVNTLIKMGTDINEIKNKLIEVVTKHDDLKERVDRIEEKIFI